MDQLNKLMEQTNAHAASVKKTLDNIKADNEAYQQKHAKVLAFCVVLSTFSGGSLCEIANATEPVSNLRTQISSGKCWASVSCSAVSQIMTDYNTASQEFKKSLKDRIKRQLKIGTLKHLFML